MGCFTQEGRLILKKTASSLCVYEFNEMYECLSDCDQIDAGVKLRNASHFCAFNSAEKGVQSLYS